MQKKRNWRAHLEARGLSPIGEYKAEGCRRMRRRTRVRTLESRSCRCVGRSRAFFLSSSHSCYPPTVDLAVAPPIGLFSAPKTKQHLPLPRPSNPTAASGLVGEKPPQKRVNWDRFHHRSLVLATDERKNSARARSAHFKVAKKKHV